MLPVPYDRPINQILTYPSNNPPYVPNVVVLPEAQPLLVFASAAVANEAGARANSSAARMFCYNLLAEHNWSNPLFGEVVKLVCDHAVLQHRMGKVNAPGACLAESTSSVLTLYASMLVISYPDLGRMMAPEHVNAAASNHRLYIDLTNNAQAMYAQTPPQAYQAPMPPQSRFASRGAIRTTPEALSNPVASGAYRGANAVASAPASQFGRQPIVTTTPQAVVSTDLPADTKPILKGEIESMDRAAHSIIYHGKDYPFPTAPLRRKLEEAVEVHENIATLEEIPEALQTTVSQVMSAEFSLDELVSVTMANWAEKAKEGLAVYRSTGIVVLPVISSIDMETCFTELSKCGTFAAVASTLQGVLDRISDKSLLRHALHFVGQINRIMTRSVNDFLRYRTDIMKNVPSITSFVEDAPNLSRYLNEKYDGKYNAAYIDYQKRVLCSLFKHTKASGDAISEMLDYMSSPFIDCITPIYAITYITASAQELGYDASGVPKYITASSTPMLRRLVEAISTYEAKRDDPPNHLLILADGSRYFMHQVYGKEVAYTLVEA